MKLPAFLWVDVGKYRLALGAPLRVQVFYAFAPFVILSLVDGWYKEPLFNWSPLAFWIADVTKFVVVPLISLALLRRYAGITARHYGLERPANLEQADFLKLVALLSVVMAYIYFASSQWAASLFPDRPTFAYSSAIPAAVPRILVTLYFALTAAFVEEIMFRGLPRLWLSGYLEGNRLRWAYLLWSSLTFAATHWENGSAQLVATLLYGLAAGGWFLLLRSLWPLIIAHLAIDAYIFL